MFLNKMLSSLHSAALAMTLTVALPAFAQGATCLQSLGTHGTAAGDWLPATASMPGSMHGRMVDSNGEARFEIFAMTHVTVPAVVSGYDSGTMYGRLMSPRIERDAKQLDKGEEGKPVVDPNSIYLLGRWTVSQKDGAGRFAAVAFLEIAPLPLPIVLLDIAGAFQVRPQADPADPKSSDARAGHFVARWLMRG